LPPTPSRPPAPSGKGGVLSSLLPLWATAVVAALAVVGCGPGGAPGVRPDVILVSIDTLRADRLNSYGYHERTLSSALDRLAGEGILFESHISASPWTTPSHLSLLTSLSPSAHGVTAPFNVLMEGLEHGHRYQRLAPEHETLAEVLARHGWATAAFTGGITLDPRIGFARGFALYDTSMAKVSEAGFRSMEGWIREHRDVPFFLFWHTFEVHAPYLHADFLGDVLPAGEAAALSAALGRLRSTPNDPLPAPQERRILEARGELRAAVCSALYDGAVRSADRWIGRLVDTLRKMGLYDHTLLVVTSDHGEQLGEEADAEGGRTRDGRFYNAHGHTLYEEMIRVPLILKLPGGRHAGQRVDGVSRAIDVMPTILDVVGLLHGAGPGQGVSLRPRWEGSGFEVPPAFSEALATFREAKSLRTDRYKYILSIGPGRVARFGRAFIPRRPSAVELYDLAVDPGERNNLLAHPDARATSVARKLDEQLRRTARERLGRPETTSLDEETVGRLKALGYVE
jgi:arylsulfatase A-like enzyme